ncbi:MAG: pyridoxal-dependent decarboxylase [Hyphomonadaceae bacterium]|nr:pyridoxal-dependent decarboxylase [Hyphomonadaceae bacterium]
MTDADRNKHTDRGTLEPRDWDAFSRAANAALDAAMDKFQTASSGRVWTPTPDTIKAQLNSPLPTAGTDLEAVTQQVLDLLPYGVGNTHPRFFGWVHGAGAPGNLIADIVASAMNANCGGRDHVGIYVERQVIDWCRTLFEFPHESSGLLVSGTSMATIIAAKTARDAALDFASRQHGVGNAPLVGYTSEQAHACLARAFDMIGLGTDALRKIAIMADHRMDLTALKAQIARDRADGKHPFFLAGTAGTVNTGAIDDLSALADIAQDEDLWFHVDGAFGACAMTSPDIAPRLKGLSRADSLAFDFHKWMHVNYDAGCVLIRDGARHRNAFANRPDYLAADGVALAGGEPWPVDYGPELSRGFRALKVWTHLKEHGTERIGQAIARNCAQAAHLGKLVEAHPDFELLAPVTLNICCFRYTRPGVSEPELDRLNATLVEQLQLDGIAAPSTTRIDGRFAIRVNITNHRTRIEDVDILLDALERLAAAR